MNNNNTKHEEGPMIEVVKENSKFESNLQLVEQKKGIFIYEFSISSEMEAFPSPVTLKWKLPSLNIKGVWKCGGVHDKRQQYDWELNHLQTRISVDAPIINVFGHDDRNIVTFACSDAINFMEMNALLREEDNHLYCHLTFFKERYPAIKKYVAYLRIDLRGLFYNEAINDVAKWWETFDDLKPSAVPDLARKPLYSTWYQFHQNLDENILLKECKIAATIGYELIILDDGWQTMDTNRGYDYTGDWEPDRFPDMKGFVEKIHAIGMKFGLWFSVPFCGKKSKAYQRFKGKFLTENHRWAPVFDPRYPEVRQYLIHTYTKALVDWNLDAFKLDFIDDFRVYPETVLTKENGRDYANVNAAVDRLMTDVVNSLRTIKEDIAIEFRQQYIGPAMRKFGNMFRAFDCPNDAVSNRIRIADVKLLCGDSAVHSDPQTWHPEESVELAALQVLNGFYGVPQMSVHLRSLPPDHLKMVRFYTEYWRAHSTILLGGTFRPVGPLSNYPVLKASLEGHAIIGVYEDVIIDLGEELKIDLLNAKVTGQIAMRNNGPAGDYRVLIRDCMGEKKLDAKTHIPRGLIDLKVPPSGMVQLIRL